MQRKAYSYIRFSTPKQLKGDSLRRQLEASRAYAKQHNLVLDESLRDIGVSAFKGKNATEGALRRFIEQVEAGRVESGSILILESLDRLSRQQVFSALSLFSSILSAGIEIVTLADGQRYTADSINEVGQLIYSLMSLSRSHEESAMKSKRLSASWENKRRQAVSSGKPMTRQCPKWLRVSTDRQRFEIIEERAEIIRRIFNMSISGTGQRRIAEQFNREAITPLGAGSMWHSSYIRKVLNSKATIGEIQLMKDGIPVGDPITDYYPAIISEETYYKAKAAQKKRRTEPSSAGRKGETYSNLFTGMCKCLSCGSTFRLIKNGRSHTFRCNSNYMASGCACTKRWGYHDVENTVLLILSEKIDWFSALGGHTNNRQHLESDIASLKAKLTDAERQVERFAELFTMTDGAMMSDARNRYLKAMQEADDIQSDIDAKEAELRTYTPVQHQVDGLNRMIFALDSESDASRLYELRAQINGVFRDAGLRLYFNEHGVYYYIGTTGQKDVLLINEHQETISMAAELERLQRTISGMDDYTAEIIAKS